MSEGNSFRPPGWRLLQAQDPVLLAVGAIAIAAVMDALVKGAALHYPLLMILFWRFVIGSCLVGIPFFASGRRLPGWRATRFHLARGLVHAATTLLFFYSVTQLPLAEATVLAFTAMLMTAPLERFFLKEPVHGKAVLATVIGFAGVLVIVQGPAPAAAPDTDPFWGRAAALAAAACYALSLVMLRARAAADGPLAMALYTNVMPALWLAGPAILLEPLPPAEALPTFAAFAVLGTAVWVIMSMAYARAPAQRLAPVDYTALLWAMLLGWIFFGEQPPATLYLGAAAIIGGCLLTAYDTRKARRQLRASSGAAPP